MAASEILTGVVARDFTAKPPALDIILIYLILILPLLKRGLHGLTMLWHHPPTHTYRDVRLYEVQGTAWLTNSRHI